MFHGAYEWGARSTCETWLLDLQSLKWVRVATVTASGRLERKQLVLSTEWVITEESIMTKQWWSSFTLSQLPGRSEKVAVLGYSILTNRTIHRRMEFFDPDSLSWKLTPWSIPDTFSSRSRLPKVIIEVTFVWSFDLSTLIF